MHAAQLCLMERVCNHTSTCLCHSPFAIRVPVPQAVPRPRDRTPYNFAQVEACRSFRQGECAPDASGALWSLDLFAQDSGRPLG